MGPITILVRRPSLRLPVAKGDLQEEVGHIQSVGRVSAYYSESVFGCAPQGDPPHWAVQALAQRLRSCYKLTLFNFDLIQPEQPAHENGALPLQLRLPIHRTLTNKEEKTTHMALGMFTASDCKNGRGHII